MKKVCIANYLYVLIMMLAFTVSTVFGQVKVIHFNAGWNEANDVEWFDKLSDAGKKSLSIDDQEIQKNMLLLLYLLSLFSMMVKKSNGFRQT